MKYVTTKDYHRVEIKLADLEGKSDEENKEYVRQKMIEAGFNMNKISLSYLTDKASIIIFQDEELKIFGPIGGNNA